MEVKREVKTFQVDFKCPKCEYGYLNQIPSRKHIMLKCIDDAYLHKCNSCSCGYEQELDKIYPYIIHEIIKRNY